jgi:hypothetical protein
MKNSLQNVLEETMEFLFGCHHPHMGMPVTIGGRTYRVCSDCGKQRDYSWNDMSFVRVRR